MNTPNWNSISQLPSAQSVPLLHFERELKKTHTNTQSFPFLHFERELKKNTHIPKAFLYFTLQGSSKKNKHTHPKLSFPSLCNGVKKNIHTHTHTHLSFPSLCDGVKKKCTPKAFLHFASKPIKHVVTRYVRISNHEVPKRKETHDPNHGFCILRYISPLSSLISAPIPSPWSTHPSWPAPPHPTYQCARQHRACVCFLRVGAPRKKAARQKGTKYSKHETNMPKGERERERERVCVCVSLSLSSALIQDSINPREKVWIHPRRIFSIFHQL
jgi:hypothetical protein